MKDVLIVGAGPAGLVAATYLARFRRTVTVLDGGPPRALWIPESHNTPGFPQGIGGRALIDRLRSQALSFGAEIVPLRATSLRKIEEGFEIDVYGGVQTARLVLMATGLVDNKPDVPGVDAAIVRGVVRLCPVCDAFEAVDKAIAVLGDGVLGAREASFLRAYSSDVTLLHSGRPLPAAETAELESKGVEVVATGPAELRLEADGVAAEIDGQRRRFDYLYLALGCRMNSDLALSVGANHDGASNLLVDDRQCTSVDGLYAAGDVVRGLNQITVAGGEAAIAAAAMNKRLPALLK